MKQSLGVCYYPEHWNENIWERDAQQMKELGLSWVRIGEFAWKEIEPTEGQFNFEWLDKAIKIQLYNSTLLIYIYKSLKLLLCIL